MTRMRRSRLLILACALLAIVSALVGIAIEMIVTAINTVIVIPPSNPASLGGSYTEYLRPGLNALPQTFPFILFIIVVLALVDSIIWSRVAVWIRQIQNRL